MSIRVQGLRGFAERLRDPLWLPLLCAVLAFGAWQVSVAANSRTVLVAAHDLPAGTLLSPAEVRTVRWPSALPGAALRAPAGRLRVGVAAGMPLLASAVGAPSRATSVQAMLVDLPQGALLSAPTLAAGDRVEVYLVEAGHPLQRVVGSAEVAAAGGGIDLEVSPADLVPLMAAIAAGHLIVVAQKN